MTFKIDLKHQLRSLKYCWLPGVLIITPLTIDALGWWPFVNFRFFWYILLVVFIFLLPVFYLHITYYIKNRNVSFTISDDSDSYTYIDNNQRFEFKQRDIDVIEQHIGIYQENNRDFANRRITLWTNYHYVKIQLKSGNHFFLTSLMIDYKSFPMHIYTTKYRFIPYLK